MTFQQAWQEICDWLATYAGDQPAILIFAIVSLVYLLIFSKDIRTRIILPILFLIPIVINPFLYKILFYRIRYWRLFWMLPDTVLIALALIDLSRRVKWQSVKCLLLAAFSAMIIFSGKNVFLQDNWATAPTDNLYGVSSVTREVCDVILQDNPHPKVIFTDWIYNQTRMYSADIEQLYGRDYDWFIYSMDPEIRIEVNHWMKEPKDWDYLFEYASTHGITHICMHAESEQKQIAPKYGFTEIAEFDWRSVFKNDLIK